MQSAARSQPPSDSGTFPAPALPTGPRWAQREIAITSARARGVSESAIRSTCARYIDAQYATRKAVWWSDRFEREASREAFAAAGWVRQ